MIYELYSFSPGTFVVADEWNANFKTLYKTGYSHAESIEDAFNLIAFYDSDLSGVYNAVRDRKDSEVVFGNSCETYAGYEYYKSLSNNEQINITIRRNMCGESRVLIYIPDQRYTKPFVLNYSGTLDIEYGFYNYDYFRPGYYYIMIYENNGLAQVKLIWTGV